MGHRGFETTKSTDRDSSSTRSKEERERGVEAKKAKHEQEHGYIRTPNPKARDYFEEMAPVNGVHQMSEEQMAAVQDQRDAFRDQVSKRMGELLLRGVTMLDAYCQTCNGILMEDRNEVRTCVACELFDETKRRKMEEEGNAIGARLLREIPLDSGMHDDDIQPAALNTERREMQPSAPSTVQVVDIPRGAWAREEPEIGMRRANEEEHVLADVKGVVTPGTKISTDALSSALRAVENKLLWTSAEIEKTSDLQRLHLLFQIVREGADAIEAIRRIRD